jgi:exonuclease SbcD
MKILISSDWHLDAITAGVPRVSELDLYLEALEEVIESQEIDAAILGGDYFDPGGMRAHELTALLIEAVGRLARRLSHLIVIAGNHDVVETSEGWTTLSPLREAIAAFGGMPGACNVKVAEKPGFHLLTTPFHIPNRVGVLALPYTARAVDAQRDLERAVQEASEFGGKLVVMGHMTVPGASLGSESKEMARGRDLDLPVATIAELRPRFVFNGHYHRAQVVPGPVPVIIPGSPWRVTFGEAGDVDKGFLVVEV